MLGSPILYLRGMRILMFQLSGFYYNLEALIIESGLVVNYTITIIRNPHNNAGNYLSPYIFEPLKNPL